MVKDQMNLAQNVTTLGTYNPWLGLPSSLTLLRVRRMQLRQQNVELKRRSQQLLEQMQIVDINLDTDQVDDSTPDGSADEDNTRALNKQILCNYKQHSYNT